MRFFKPLTLCALCLSLLVASLVAGCAAPRELKLGTTHELIQKKAKRQGPILWQIPLGSTVVDAMHLIGTESLLVGLKEDTSSLANLQFRLVERNTGKIRWQFNRKKYATYHLLAEGKDALIFRVQEGEDVQLLALDLRTGQPKWKKDFSGKHVDISSVLGNEQLVIDNWSEGNMQVTLLDLDNGTSVWEHKSSIPDSVLHLAPIVSQSLVWKFAKGVEAVSLKNGQQQWVRSDLNLENAPSPQLWRDMLLVIHSDSKLSALDQSTGKNRWTTVLPDGVTYTNIFPNLQNIYLRGVRMSQEEDVPRHFLLALHRDTGQLLWTRWLKDLSVSNLLESGGLVYFGTPRTLEAFHVKNGKGVFSTEVTTTGRTYPIRIRKLKDRILYMGELVVGAYDAKSGKEMYKRGVTPVSPEGYLDGLDAAIPRLKEDMAQVFGQAPDNSAANFALAEARNYQNLSNQYHARADELYSEGMWSTGSISGQNALSSAQGARLSADIYSSASRMQSTIALSMATIQLGDILGKVLKAKGIQTSMERLQYYRNSILTAYAQAETEDYVYRPHLVYRSTDNEFNGVSIIHLPTGKRRMVYLSPNYLTQGLWNIVDVKNGVVFHHGLGLDPSRYGYGNSHPLPGYGDVKTLQPFLIATTVDLPK